jgi:two-component system, OmpR family, phosphate regulon response regulator OmpR
MKIALIAEDNEIIRDLEAYLSSNDVAVIAANSGREGLAIIGQEHLDLAILDLGITDMKGLEVLRYIVYEYQSLPVFLLTTRDDEVDGILGIELGADDYLVKPFNSRGLLAKIHALARRREKLTGGKAPSCDGEPVKLDMGRRQAEVRGELLKLSSIEFDILKILILNKGTVMSRERIMELSRGKEFYALDRSIDIQISRLRQKLEKNNGAPKLIKTVWGVGYIYTGEAC